MLIARHTTQIQRCFLKLTNKNKISSLRVIPLFSQELPFSARGMCTESEVPPDSRIRPIHKRIKEMMTMPDTFEDVIPIKDTRPKEELDELPDIEIWADGPDGRVIYPLRLHNLARRLMALSTIEMMALNDILRDSMGLPENFEEVVMGGGLRSEQSGGEAQENQKDSAKPQEKTEFDVILEGFDAKDKIKVIKEVRTVTGLGLKEVTIPPQI